MVFLPWCRGNANQSINQSIVILWAPKDAGGKSSWNTRINPFPPRPQALAQPGVRSKYIHVCLYSEFCIHTLVKNSAPPSFHRMLRCQGIGLQCHGKKKNDWILFSPPHSSSLIPHPFQSCSFSSLHFSLNGKQHSLAAVSSYSRLHYNTVNR